MLSAQRFAELEYETLRKEIENAKNNMLKFVIGGSAVIPSAQYLAEKYSIGAITLALPIIVVVLVLLFLAENHSMMRAGTYIRNVLEPNVNGLQGWETWLSSEGGYKKARMVDKLIIFSFSLVAAAYFVASITLAVRYAASEFGDKGQYVVLIGYVFVGMALGGVLYKQARTDTEPSHLSDSD